MRFRFWNLFRRKKKPVEDMNITGLNRKTIKRLKELAKIADPNDPEGFAAAVVNHLLDGYLDVQESRIIRNKPEEVGIL